MSFIVNSTEETKLLSVEYKGSMIEFHYCPDRYDADLEAAIHDCIENQRPAKMLVQIILALVVSWNLVKLTTNEEGESVESPILLNELEVSSLNTRLLSVIQDAIVADQNPPKE